MTNELTMLLCGHEFAQIRDAAILSYVYRWHNTINQATGVYMHWVILGMDLEYQALGYNRILYKTTYNCKYGSCYTHKSN